MQTENHMVLNTADAPWNQPDADEPSAAERAESEARAARELAAAELADGFSQVAEFIRESEARLWWLRFTEA